MEKFLDKLGIKHKRTIPLWPRENGEEERENKSLLKAMRVAHAEGKPWQRKLQKHLLAYRLTPHSTTGVSPADKEFYPLLRESYFIKAIENFFPVFA